MNAPYKNIALAVSFSPTSKMLVTEAVRLKDLFSAKLSFVHIGSHTADDENKMRELMSSTGLKNGDVEIFWQNGDPVKALENVCADKNIDLLIVGALEEESAIKYYLGSDARSLMREAPCSVLFFKTSSLPHIKFQQICVSLDYSDSSEIALRKAHNWALCENISHITLIREIQVPGLAMAVNDSGSVDEMTDVRRGWEKDEINKMDFFVKELNLTGIEFNSVCLYGKQGWEARNYVDETQADLFVINAPKKKLGFFDRLFPSGLEYIVKQLPCALLIVKTDR